MRRRRRTGSDGRRSAQAKRGPYTRGAASSSRSRPARGIADVLAVDLDGHRQGRSPLVSPGQVVQVGDPAWADREACRGQASAYTASRHSRALPQLADRHRVQRRVEAGAGRGLNRQPAEVGVGMLVGDGEVGRPQRPASGRPATVIRSRSRKPLGAPGHGARPPGPAGPRAGVPGPVAAASSTARVAAASNPTRRGEGEPAAVEPAQARPAAAAGGERRASGRRPCTGRRGTPAGGRTPTMRRPEAPQADAGTEPVHDLVGGAVAAQRDHHRARLGRQCGGMARRVGAHDLQIGDRR